MNLKCINPQGIKEGDSVYIEYLDGKDVNEIFYVVSYKDGDSSFKLSNNKYCELNMIGQDSYLKLIPELIERYNTDEELKLVCQGLIDIRRDKERYVKSELLKYNIKDNVVKKVVNLTSSAGYHNKHHLYSFLMNLMLTEDFNKANIEEKRVLLLAGLLHDGMHIQDKDDLKNIKSSCHLVDILKYDLELDSKGVKEVKNLIKSTINDYRYNPKILEDVKYSGLMQDTDLMSNFDKDNILFRYGLSLELNMDINLESTITFLKLYDIKCESNKIIFKEGIEQLERELNEFNKI